MKEQWSGVSVSIGGVSFGGLESGATWSEVERADTFEASGTFMVPADSYRALLEALRPRTRGASDATLAKRASYFGGRKSRRAFARLCAKGYAGICTVNGGPPFPLPPVMVRSSLRPDTDAVASSE